MTRDDYEAYLRSPEWQSLRERVVHREHGCCQGCGVEPGTEVHHVSYARVGRELLLDLVLLCPKCHGAMHPYRSAAPVVVVPLDAPQMVSAEDEDAYLRACEARAKARRADG